MPKKVKKDLRETPRNLRQLDSAIETVEPFATKRLGIPDDARRKLLTADPVFTKLEGLFLVLQKVVGGLDV